MAEEAVATIVMSVDGLDYDCSSFSAQKTTGRKIFPTMNREQRNKFKGSGNRAYSWSCSVVIPNKKDSVDWDNLDDARIAIESPDGNYRETYLDCSTTEVSDSYSVDGETRRDLSGFAMDYLKESL